MNVLHTEGPDRLPLRRVGNVFFTRAFATETFVQAILARSSINATQTHMEGQLARSKTELMSLLPGAKVWWQAVLEDIFFSPSS